MYNKVSDNANIFKTYMKYDAVENCLENELYTPEEGDVLKDFLDEYYDSQNGLVQFVYDYMRDSGYVSVRHDKEELKRLFSEMVENNYYLISRR